MIGQGQFTRKDFLDALFAQYYREHRGFILVRTLQPDESKVATRYFPNIEVLGRELYGEDVDVYFGVCPRERMKPEKEHVKFILALWADIDIGPDAHKKGESFFAGPEEAAMAIRDFPLPPSITVDSGHGLHLYWLLDKATEVANPAATEEIIRKVQRQLNCKMNPNLDAVMRLPDTFNNKILASSVPCAVKFINVNFRYSLDDFKDVTADARPSVKKSPMRFEPEPLTGHPMGAGGLDAAVDSSRATPSRPKAIADVASANPASPHVAAVDLADGRLDRESHAEPASPAPTKIVASPPGPSSGRDQSILDREMTGGPMAQEKLFARLIAQGTMVELVVKGSDAVIRGKIEWVGREWLGLVERDARYAIPVTAISFV
ncbi:MAG: hypothetical protein ACPL7J_06820, partial [Desulfomonilaceae bacterium]